MYITNILYSYKDQYLVCVCKKKKYNIIFFMRYLAVWPCEKTIKDLIYQLFYPFNLWMKYNIWRLLYVLHTEMAYYKRFCDIITSLQFIYSHIMEMHTLKSKF